MKNLVKVLMIALFFAGYGIPSFSQDMQNGEEGKGQFLYRRVIDGNDTVLTSVLPPVSIYARARKSYRKKAREYNRLRNAVYVTYPYARIASGVLKEVDSHLTTLQTDKERKSYLKFKEEELQSAFGPKIKDLSMYQGKVLIKLIYRETGSNTYDLIKQLRGGFSARFWQTVAFVFGGNLKEPYDLQRDKDIESFVREIEFIPFYHDAYYHPDRFN